MKIKSSVSNQTRKNWYVDSVLFISALIASLSGIYFLFIPSGGYQGGRNPWHNVTILFSRHTWEDWHTWGGLVMIAIALVHLIIHWSWVVSMARRMIKEINGKCSCLNPRGRWNLALNTVLAASFLVTALSGLYLFFVPGGRGAIDPMILLPRTTWDLLHTWSGVAMIVAAILHFAIHWKWVAKVSGSIVRSLFPTRSENDFSGALPQR